MENFIKQAKTEQPRKGKKLMNSERNILVENFL